MCECVKYSATREYGVLFFIMILYNPYLSFFFFQAEDGIRDGHVTGVQTVCSSDLSPRHDGHRAQGVRCDQGVDDGRGARSEERRAGKECRSPWAPHHQKKKKDR